jgi:hypothetical protein
MRRLVKVEMVGSPKKNLVLPGKSRLRDCRGLMGKPIGFFYRVENSGNAKCKILNCCPGVSLFTTVALKIGELQSG